MEEIKSNISNSIIQIRKNNKPKPFIVPGSLEPITQEDIKRRRLLAERAKEIGVNITRFTSGDEEVENPYRVQALVLIAKGEPVTEELKQKIKEFDKSMKRKIEKEGIDIKDEALL